MKTERSRLRLVFCVAMLACAGWARASVVMTGTRVIYPANQAEQTLQFHNPDAHPNVVQVWLDGGDRTSSPDTVETPFVALPQVFRIEPHTGQMVRLLRTDTDALPQDRESLFYLNFSQLPVRKKHHASANQLRLMFTSRVKVFYRPEGIDANLPPDIGQQLQLTWRGDALHVHNPSAYHVVVRQADMLQGDAPIPLAQGVTIAPFARTVWTAPEAAASMRGMPLRLVLRNDYGSDVTVERQLS